MPAVHVAQSRRFGVFCIVISAVGFGAMPVFAKIAYAQGVDLTSLLFLRFSLAGGLMTAFLSLRRQPWPRGGTLLALMAMGGLGYFGQSFCYFSALQHATAGLTALLLYLYPVMVTVLSTLLERRRLSGSRILAVMAALGGTALAVGGVLAGSMTGVLLGVGAALIYSVYILVGERVTTASGAMASATVIMLSAALVYGGIALAQGPRFPASITGWCAAGAIALISTILAMIAFFAGMQRLGAADAATLSTLEPVVTVVLAGMFLGEAVGGAQLLGGLIVLGAVLVLVRSPDRSRTST